MTIEKEIKDKEREDMQILNKDRKLTVNIPRHKSVVYKDIDFTETFKNLREVELYSNFYSTELNKNLEKIDQKFLSFRERFDRIKKTFESQDYLRSDKPGNQLERPIEEFKELEILGENLKNLYNYHFLYEKYDDKEKLHNILGEFNREKFKKDKEGKVV